MLTKDDILKTADLKIKEIDIPEWGGQVCLKVISSLDRDRYESWYVSAERSGNYEKARSLLVAMSLCDDKGVLLFNPKDSNDLAAIGNKNSLIIDRIWAEARKLNGIDGGEKDKEKN